MNDNVASRRSGRLLAGVSFAALALVASTVAPTEARADSLADRPTWMFIEGAYDFVEGDNQGWADTSHNAIPALKSRDTVGPSEGWHGTLGIVTPLGDTAYDAGFSIRYGETNTASEDDDFAAIINGISTNNNLGGAPRDTVSHKEEHLIVDFSARRDVGMGQPGGTRVTGIGGIRFAHFDAQTDENFASSVLFFRNKRTSRFYGAGPMIGLETVTPLNETVSFDFGADASILLGDMHRKVSTSNTFYTPAHTDSHQFRVVPTVGASAAFSFMPAGMGGAKITLGVKADAWFGAYDQKVDRPTPGSPDANDDGEKHADRFNVSPFLRLVIPLGG